MRLDLSICSQQVLAARHDITGSGHGWASCSMGEGCVGAQRSK